MEIYIKVNGKMGRLMAMASSVMSKEDCMKEIGHLIIKREKVLKPGTTGRSDMKVISIKGRSQEKVGSNLREAHTKETSLTENSMGMENIISLNQEKFTMVNLLIINWKEME